MLVIGCLSDMGMKTAAWLALLTWVVALIYFSSSLFSIQKGDATDDRLTLKLREALDGIEELRTQNKMLKKLAEDERSEHAENLKLLKQLVNRNKLQDEGRLPKIEEKDPSTIESSKKELYSKEHEELRRLVSDRILEAYFYAHSHLSDEKVDRKKAGKHLEDQLISLLGVSSRFSSVEGATEWRKTALANLTTHVQSTIHKLQHPTDCAKQKIAVCNLDKQCGFGCQLHHVAYCFSLAFGEQRTLILEGDGSSWRYSHQGWKSTFLPVSSCTHKEALGSDHATSFSPNSLSRVVSIPIVDSLRQSPSFLPLAFPSSISDQLLTLHSNPSVFFVGQLLWYLMRSTPDLEKHLDEAAEKVPFDKGPVVGLQVRRTDKVGTEAAFHGVDEYMQWAEVYFRVEEAKLGEPVKRRVLIATDDPNVIKEAREKYKEYEVYGDEGNANTAQMDSRYTDSSLLGVITDIQQLSRCAHLVCTFSSQVCRMGYELMQVRQQSTGEEFHSLDDIYYFGGQQAHDQVAFESYAPETAEEIELKSGDVVGIAGNHWNGFSKGTNKRTGKVGLYPSYKVKEQWRIVDFPALPPLP